MHLFKTKHVIMKQVTAQKIGISHNKLCSKSQEEALTALLGKECHMKRGFTVLLLIKSKVWPKVVVVWCQWKV